MNPVALWVFALVTYSATAVVLLFTIPSRPDVASAVAVGGGVQALICWWLWGNE